MSYAIGFVVLLILLALGFHVSTVLFLIGVIGASLGLGSAVVMDFSSQAWTVLNNFVMIGVPLFILMGELLLRSGITDSIYSALSVWLGRLPGGLLHTNIGACAIMAAGSGSSVATAATLGTVAIPTFKARGYDDRIVLGSLAAGGTLGILIPPSVNMIIYGSIAGVSIGHLFMGGVIPGLLLALSFSAAIAIAAILKPSLIGKADLNVSFKDKLKTLPSFFPPMFIIFAVMGSIYFGWATPTEAAALGVLSVFFLALLKGRVSIQMLHDSFLSTIKTSSMILLIMVAAFYMNFVISLLGMPQALSEWFATFDLGPKTTMFLIIIFYLILGTFIETVAMMVTTISLVVPIVVAAGYDPLWFGIFLVVLCEASLITPPIGMNLYVVQGVRSDGGPIRDVIIGSMPFLLMMIILLFALIYLPELALWLPKYMT